MQIRALDAARPGRAAVVDEPALHVFGTEGVERAWDPLRAVAPPGACTSAVRCRGTSVDRAEPDVLSFDLALAPLDARAARTLSRLVARGGRVAWGVVQPHRPEHALHALPRLRAALAVVAADGDHSLLTASCGSGRMSPAREAEITTALWDTAHAARRCGFSMSRLSKRPVHKRVT